MKNKILTRKVLSRLCSLLLICGLVLMDTASLMVYAGEQEESSVAEITAKVQNGQYTDDVVLTYISDREGNLTQVEYTASSAANQQEIYNYLTKNMGLNAAAACGVLANIFEESNFDPTTVGDGGTSYGICQWHNSRKNELINYCNSHGYDYKTINGQMHFLEYELSDSYYRHILDKLKSVSNTANGAYDAGYYWCYYFEMPSNYPSVSVKRGNLAKNTYWPIYGKTASLPFRSCIDEPVSGRDYSGAVRVKGWAILGTGITRVTASVNGYTVTCTQTERKDVAAVYPGYPTGKEGFTASLSAAYLVNGSNTITFKAYNGSDSYNIGSVTIRYSRGNIKAAFGDVDWDGSIGSTDALLVLKAVANTWQLTDEQKTYADVDGNKKISVEDALLILKKVSNVQMKFPVDQ